MSALPSLLSLSGLLGPVVALFVSLATALGPGVEVGSSGPGSSVTGSGEGVVAPDQPEWPGDIPGLRGTPLASRDDLVDERLRQWRNHERTGPNAVRIYFTDGPPQCHGAGYRTGVHETDTTIRIDLYSGTVPERAQSDSGPDVGRPEHPSCRDIAYHFDMDVETVETVEPIGDREIIQQF